MAQARSWIQLSGSMGETTFKKRGKKTFANDKVVISKAKVKSHKSYGPLRQNGSELSNASSNARIIRQALQDVVHYCKDPKMYARLTSEVMKVLKRDNSAGAFTRGQVARAENMGHLLGFNFNEKAQLRAKFNVAFTTEVNRETGEVKIKIASFKPARAIKSPPLATQFKIRAQVAQIDFNPAIAEHAKYERMGGYASDFIQLNETPTDPQSITLPIKTGKISTIFIALGVDFWDASNPVYAEIEQSVRVSAGCIVAVDEGEEVAFGEIPA